MINRYTKDNVEAAGRVSRGLYEMCDWNDTEEGHDFWYDIAKRVARIRHNLELVSKPALPDKL